MSAVASSSSPAMARLASVLRPASTSSKAWSGLSERAAMRMNTCARVSAWPNALQPSSSAGAGGGAAAQADVAMTGSSRNSRGLYEKAALVAEQPGLEQQHLRNRRARDLH